MPRLSDRKADGPAGRRDGGCVEERAGIVHGRVGREDRRDLAALEFGRGLAKASADVIERAEVIVHERLSRDPDDPAEGLDAVGFLRVAHLAALEFGAFDHLLQRRGFRELNAGKGFEVAGEHLAGGGLGA